MAAECRRELADSRYSYPDPADLWLAKYAAIVERGEKGQLSERDGDRQMKELSVHIRKEIEGGRRG